MTAKLTFGTFLAPYHPLGDNPFISMQRDLEVITRCDELGFDEAWVGEHHSAAWETITDPAVFLAAAGERTSHINLGSGANALANATLCCCPPDSVCGNRSLKPSKPTALNWVCMRACASSELK